MSKVLNNKQIEYVFYHLNLLFDFNQTIKSKIYFFENEVKLEEISASIIFQLSANSIDYKNIMVIDEIPVLYPNNDRKEFFTFYGNSIIFNHDLLKSIFYLLSGYQEYEEKERDLLGRFSYRFSIQKRLKIETKPIVNYYFSIICKGIKEFCILNNIGFKEKRLFENFGFLLTHDIDRIDAYCFEEVKAKFKQFLGLLPSNYKKLIALKVFFKYLINWLVPLTTENPYWTFGLLKNISIRYNLKCVFYFLDESESNYSYSDPRIKKLIRELIENNNEVGIHGCSNSEYNLKILNDGLNKLNYVCSEKVIGIRQHYLKYYIPDTAIIQHQARLLYDTTLGFAEHEGFRNSCCTPFKLYNFQKDEIIDIWQFPLNIMDGTVFYYRNLSFKEIIDTTNQIIKEIIKFKGIFTLLWHNTMFDEDEMPGITKFYQEYINQIISYKPMNLTGRELLNLLSGII